MGKENGRRITIELSESLANENITTPIPAISEYVQDGLIRLFDGIENVEGGHEKRPEVWKDHSSNAADGIVTAGYAGEKCLLFGGKDSWVNLGNLELQVGTIEVLVWFYEVGPSDAESNIVISNRGGGVIATGGLGIQQKNGKTAALVGVGNSTLYAYGNNVDTTVPVCLQLSYDGFNVRFYENGVLVSMLSMNGLITETGDDCVMAIGRNANSEQHRALRGRVYCARIYDRALSDAEIAANYEIDKVRFVDSVVSIVSPEDFSVSIPVYDMVPLGNESIKDLKVESVVYAKSDTEQKLITLIMPEGNQNTIQNTIGDVTVEYTGGSLYGYGGSVRPFTEQFTPEGLAYKGHQHDVEHIDVNIDATFIPTRIYYRERQNPEHIDVNITANITLYHVNDL